MSENLFDSVPHDDGSGHDPLLAGEVHGVEFTGAVSAEDEARIQAHMRRLRRVAEARHRVASELAADGLQQLDDLVEPLSDIIDVAGRLSTVVRRCADILEKSLDLLIVQGHDESPSIGALDVPSSTVSALIVGEASGVSVAAPAPASDAPSCRIGVAVAS